MHERLSALGKLLITTGKDAGLIPHTQEEIAAMQEAKRVTSESERAGRARFRHMLLEHSDVGCGSEREFLLGLSDKDPHPEHKITFSGCNHPEYEGKWDERNLGWLPPNLMRQKLHFSLRPDLQP